MSCTGDLGKTASNSGQNVALGILNFFGIGSAIKGATGWKTPLDNLKDQLSDIQAKTSAFRNKANLRLFKAQFIIDEKFIELIQLSNDELVAMEKLIQEILQEEISLNLVYITFLYIFFIIVYFYIIFKK